MKKLFILATVAVLIFGLGVATYAMEIKASGWIWQYTAFGRNFAAPPPFGLPAPDDPTDPTSNTGYNDSYAQANIWSRLKIDVEMSEDLKGVLQWEMGWNGPAYGVPDEIAQYNADFIGVRVKHVYVDFKVPGTDAFPTRMKVGIQAYAASPQLAIDEDGPGVSVATQAGPASVTLFWRKHLENQTWQADDFDSYGGIVSIPAGPVTPQVWSCYYLDRPGSTTNAALPAGVTSDGYWWYTGFNGRGNAGPVGFWWDFVYGMGKIDYNYAVMGTGTLGQPVVFSGEDYSGWVARANASIPVGMVTVGGEFMYSTGDDNNDITNDQEWSGYRYPPGTSALFGNAGLVYYSSYTCVPPGLTMSAGGDWYVKGFASLKPLDWMTVTFNGMYIGDTVKNGDRLGTSVNFIGLPEDNSDAGIEVNMFTDFRIYDNLSYTIAAGYLFAGSALDQVIPGSAAFYGIPINDSPDDPWCVVSYLNFVF